MNDTRETTASCHSALFYQCGVAAGWDEQKASPLDLPTRYHTPRCPGGGAHLAIWSSNKHVWLSPPAPEDAPSQPPPKRPRLRPTQFLRCECQKIWHEYVVSLYFISLCDGARDRETGTTKTRRYTSLRESSKLSCREQQAADLGQELGVDNGQSGAQGVVAHDAPVRGGHRDAAGAGAHGGDLRNDWGWGVGGRTKGEGRESTRAGA